VQQNWSTTTWRANKTLKNRIPPEACLRGINVPPRLNRKYSRRSRTMGRNYRGTVIADFTVIACDKTRSVCASNDFPSKLKERSLPSGAHSRDPLACNVGLQ
jgi:hypothetical protein